MRRMGLMGLLTLALIWGGCASRELDPAGPYRGDALLWRADGVIVEVNAAYNDLETLAARNPGFVTENPKAQAWLMKIKAERDGVPQPGEVLGTLIAARDTYSLYRQPPEANELQRQLLLARLVLTQLAGILTPVQPPVLPPLPLTP